jgi:transcriptional regulator with XRE-family HTH domain
MEPKEIGRRIQAARKRKHWTQLEFAHEAAISPSSVARWERGQLPSVRELIRVAGVLEIDPEELVEEEPSEDDQLADLREELAGVRGLAEEAVQILRGLQEQAR